MPHATTSRGPYAWTSSPSSSSLLTRKFTNLERMFVIFNQRMHGQNAPFMGAKIRITIESPVPFQESLFCVHELQKRGITAMLQTRHRYPTVAAQILDADTALYKVESADEVSRWGKRCVRIVNQDGGWRALREKLSREATLPTAEGDTCLFYLILRPGENSVIDAFDVLMHTHHAFTDGSGIRVILNEFLERIAAPLEDGELTWGGEVERLLPGCVDLEREEEVEKENDFDNAGGFTKPLQEERLKGFHTPDIGLPVYRPELQGLTPSMRGTLLECHTFASPTFLPQLLVVGRKHGIKLTSVLHATLLRAIYLSLENKPNPGDVFKSGSPMDLRNGYLVPDYCDRTRYVNSAVAIQPIHVPCELFQGEDGFWGAAGWISGEWDLIKQKKGLARAVETDAMNILDALERSRTSPKLAVAAKPRTCPSFVSDPPGTQGLRGTYPVTGYAAMALVLESYQLATDQMQAVISARAHSYNGLLTLCLAFNAVRNPREKMQEFLGIWMDVVREVCSEGGACSA